MADELDLALALGLSCDVKPKKKLTVEEQLEEGKKAREQQEKDHEKYNRYLERMALKDRRETEAAVAEGIARLEWRTPDVLKPSDKMKEDERAKIEAAKAAFLKKGGEIKKRNSPVGPRGAKWKG